MYQQETAHRDELRRASREKVAGLVEQISGGACENPKLESMLRELANRLSNVKGKRVYGYLRPELKALVNQIVDELAKDERIAQLYDLWYQDKQTARNVYDERPLQRVPLSENPDFKPVRNAMIQAAIVLPPMPISPVEDEVEPDISEPSPSQGENPIEDPPVFSHSRGKTKTFWTEEYLKARQNMYGDQAFPPDLPLAVQLMKSLADENPLAAHDLGVLLLKGMGCQADEDEAQRWFQKALAGFQKAAATEKKPAYFQYRVGKMYAMGLRRGAGTTWKPPAGTSGPPGTTTIRSPPTLWGASTSVGRGWSGMRNGPWNSSSQRRSTRSSPTPTPCTSWEKCTTGASARKSMKPRLTSGTSLPTTLLCP